MPTKVNEARVVVNWDNANYFEVSRHLEDIFEKYFSGSGVDLKTMAGDASFYVKEDQADAFIYLLETEMLHLKKEYYKRLTYSINKEQDVD